MATPSKAQWDEIKEKLSCPYGVAYFKCDDYLIHAEVRLDKMKLVIEIYVNGWIKGKWWWSGIEQDISNMPEIPRRFYCLTRKGKTAKDIKLNLKIFGKKRCKEKGYNDPFCMAYPIFKTPGAFITHLKKHNPSIEVLDYEAYTQAKAALPEDEDTANSAELVTEDEHA